MQPSIVKVLESIRDDIRSGKIATASSLANRIEEALKLQYSKTSFPRLVSSEPPSSIKHNLMVGKLEKAIMDHEYVFDLLLAAAYYDFDTAMAILNDLEDKAAGLMDTVKTLYFFSEPARAGVHSVGVDFLQGWGVFRGGETDLYRDRATGITLPVVTKKSATGRAILEGDGIAGNYFLVDDDELAADSNSRSLSSYIFDSSPSTFFEYERFRISQETFGKCKGYGFGFADDDREWASPDFNDVNLQIAISLNTPQTINYLIVNPGTSEDYYTIKSIVLYSGGTEARVLEPSNLHVNPELYMHGHQGYVNYATYMFPPTVTEEVVIKLTSDVGNPCTIRHYYEVDESGERVPGESPSIHNPNRLIPTAVGEDSLRKVEDLPAERYYVGVKDLSIQRIKFGVEGNITSQPIQFSRPIDRIALEADYTEPEDCAILFTVSFDGGESWYEITPLGKAIKGQVIAVNDMIPAAYQDPSTTYVAADGAPSEFLVRVAMERQKGSAEISPILKNLKLEVTLKQ